MSRLVQLWLDVRGSFWFLPSVIITGGIALALGVLELDAIVGDDFQDRWTRLFVVSPEGARNVLGTIAGSMITVAGLVFSITLVVLSLASSQYSSRVLRNFMLDRVNQSVLGVFLGIFVYCLVVLRTVRGGGESQYVPSIAILGGLILGVLGLAVLIYYIHHISKSIQASQIAYVVFHETARTIDTLFPDELADDRSREEPDAGRKCHDVYAASTGYVRTLNAEVLRKQATENDWVIRMLVAPGEFVTDGVPVMSVLGDSAPAKEQVRTLARAVMTGRQRNAEQDVGFGIRQLVDVALKALSPGINDTTTAVMCMDYLTALIMRLAGRAIVADLFDDDGALLVIAGGPTFEGLLDQAYDQIRESSEGNTAMLLHMLHSMERLAGQTRSARRRKALLVQVEATREAVARTIRAPGAREHLLGEGTRIANQLAAQA